MSKQGRALTEGRRDVASQRVDGRFSVDERDGGWRTSAVEVLPMSLLTKTSKASFIALWKMECPWKQPFSGPVPTSSVYLS